MTNLCVRFSALPIRTSLQPPFQTSMCSDLYGNQLSGTVPQSFGSLTGLTWLCVLAFLSRCTLAAVLHPVRSDLSYNQLSGTIPSSLGSLTRLSNLCVTCVPPPAVTAFPKFSLQRSQRQRPLRRRAHVPSTRRRRSACLPVSAAASPAQPITPSTTLSTAAKTKAAVTTATAAAS